MASKNKASAPLTFDLNTGLLRKIEDYQRKAGVRSKSEVIRDAIESYDYGQFSRQVEPHRQISVRLPAGQKRELTKLAKQKKVSLGELLRVALQALPAKPVKKADPKAATAAAPSAKAKKPAARKVAPKKGPVKKTSGKTAIASKTTAKRGPAKRASTAKTTPTRAAAKRATTQRATAGKAPARKAVARKASSPRATSRTPAKRTTKKR